MMQNSNENNVLPNRTKVDKFIIDSHIGHGGYGEIYAVYDENQNGPYAMKVEMKSAKKHGLTEEIHYLKMLRGSSMFPAFYTSGETNDLRYFIMELLGPSISVIRRSLPEQRYSKLTATILAKEMLKCIEELHKRGYVHRDIKPGNFLIRPNRSSPVVLIDFGLSKRFLDRETGKPIPPRQNPGFIGTCSFASVNAHEGKELGRRDDIISWLYTAIEMVEKKLPWPGSKDRDKTYRLKQTIKPLELFRSLPRAFSTIYMKTIDLTFYDCPPYQNFYRQLDKAINELGGFGKPFDWEYLPEHTINVISPIPLDMGPLTHTDNEGESPNAQDPNARLPASKPKPARKSTGGNEEDGKAQSPSKEQNRDENERDNTTQEERPSKQAAKSKSSNSRKKGSLSKPDSTPQQSSNNGSGLNEGQTPEELEQMRTTDPIVSPPMEIAAATQENLQDDQNAQTTPEPEDPHTKPSRTAGTSGDKSESVNNTKALSGQKTPEQPTTNSAKVETPDNLPQTKKSKEKMKPDKEPGCKACNIC